MKENKSKTREREITPEYARRKLEELAKLVEEGTFRNRPINKKLVASYASDMIRGRWGLTHQGIAFDEHGRLVDGQHRLWAVVKAGIPVTMMVTTGLPASTNGGYSIPTMDVIDCGKNRTVGQKLRISHGISGASQVASVVRNIAYVYTNDREIKLSVSQVLEVMDMHEPAIEMLFGVTTDSRQRVGPVLAPMAVYYMTHPEQAKSFAVSFFNKEELKKGSPVLALIKWLEKNPHVGGKEHYFTRLYAVSHCIHEYHHEKELDVAMPREEAMYWLGALNKKNAEAIRKMIYPLRTA